MRFRDHSRYAGSHALLSPSKSSWIHYDEERLESMVHSTIAARRGTQLHELACNLIRLGERLPESTRTLNQYVNDCIGFRLSPEQILMYSPLCFGQADAIGFRQGWLRIFDLKTGVTPCKFDQLLIYAALFCLEYNIKPMDIKIELRIYQNDEVRVVQADPLDIMSIMDMIILFDSLITDLSYELLGLQRFRKS